MVYFSGTRGDNMKSPVRLEVVVVVLEVHITFWSLTKSWGKNNRARNFTALVCELGGRELVVFFLKSRG